MVDLRALVAESLGDRYRIARELTGGGMSRVFLAEEVALSREVVVKVLSPDLVGVQHIERFRQEILQTVRLQHPSIVPILSVGTLRYPTGATAPYYIMPYIRGETLRSRLEREGPFSAVSILRVLRDVLEALVHAHRHAVIHRDIKPENIFISGGHAVVTDFGIAKAVSISGDSPSNTLPGVALGTPAYMAPEQAAGDDGVDHRSDLYALGVVAYELLTGRVPFSGLSTRQVLVAHVRSTPQPLSQLRPDLPPALADAVMRCMERDPARRWQTPDEMLRTLEGIRSTDPHITVSRAVAQPAPSNALRSAGLAVVGIAALAVGWFLLRPTPRAMVSSRLRSSVLVLPPTVRGDSLLQQHGDVFQTDLTHDLQRLGLSVLDPHATDGMERSTQQEIGDRLGVAYLITSSLAATEEGARLILNLVDQDFRPLWTESYRLPVGEQGAWDALVDSVAVLLAKQLPAGVQVGAESHTHEQRSRSPVVAGLVEQAGKALRTRTRDGILESIALLRQAIAVDPEDARAHATLSNAYALLTVYYYRTDVQPYGAAARALAHADLAVTLDPYSDEGFVARGYILWQINAPIDTVRAQFEAPRRLNPSVQPGWYSIMLMRENLKDSALAEARRGVLMDPLSPSRRINVAWDALGLQEDSLAVHEADSAFALEPDLSFTRGLLMHSLLAAGQTTRCAGMVAGQYYGARAACLERAGQPTDARVTLDSLLANILGAERAGDFTAAMFAQEMAIYFAVGGEPRASMLWIREAFRQAPNGMQWIVLRSRLFAPVFKDPAMKRELEFIEAAVYPRVTGEARRYLAALDSSSAN